MNAKNDDKLWKEKYVSLLSMYKFVMLCYFIMFITVDMVKIVKDEIEWLMNFNNLFSLNDQSTVLNSIHTPAVAD